MFEQVIQEIKKYDRIIIHRHYNPDGDALGSQIGLKHLILENFPGKKVFIVGDEAKRYSFMDDSLMDDIPDEYYPGSLAFILDSAARHLISDERYKLADKVIRIDHHIKCETIGDIDLVDTSYESCCGMIAELAMESSLRLNPVAATSIFTGMVTDSGRFRYDSTNSNTFRHASFLMTQPIDLSQMYSNLYADTYESMQFRASYIMKIKISPKNVAYIYTTLDEFLASGKDSFSISRGMVNLMSDIKGVSNWVNFTEVGNEVLVEIRSNKYNINPIAVKYGGGGHAKASGCSVSCYDEAMKLLDDLGNMSEENQL